MIKKIIGVVLFLVGLILSLSIFLTLLKMIFINDTGLSGKSSNYVFGYYLGKIGFLILFSILTFFILKYGLCLMRGKRNDIKTEDIETIGKN